MFAHSSVSCSYSGPCLTLLRNQGALSADPIFNATLRKSELNTPLPFLSFLRRSSAALRDGGALSNVQRMRWSTQLTFSYMPADKRRGVHKSREKNPQNAV